MQLPKTTLIELALLACVDAPLLIEIVRGWNDVSRQHLVDCSTFTEGRFDLTTADHVLYEESGELGAGEYLVRFYCTEHTEHYVYVVWNGEAITHAWLEWKEEGDDLIVAPAPEGP